jgi:histidinol-phosphate aminotransferase
MLAPEPSFSMYQVIANITGCDYVDVPRHSDFTVDIDALMSAIDQHDPCCVFLACPNNPTGNSCDPALIEKVARACSGIVLVDEAYHAFCSDSFMDRAGALDNVLVMRTLSKLGLAGLRLGFLAGPKALVSEINKVRLPYNISALTQITAGFALEHLNWFEDKAGAICHARENLHKALNAMPGVTAYPSKANFVLFRLPTAKGTIVFELLRQRGVLVKNLHSAHASLVDCLRVTVSTESQNRAFLDALSSSLDDSG